MTPVPEGFDWDLWLGPEAARPYSPDYTHMVFRGWYDFGGGSMADMGHYSLWAVFQCPGVGISSRGDVEPTLSHTCGLKDGIAFKVNNDFSFPTASTVRFKYPASGRRAAVDLVWYDGGMRPPTPPELEIDNKELPIEGMMFVGSKEKILARLFSLRTRNSFPKEGCAGIRLGRVLCGTGTNRAGFPPACASGLPPFAADRNRPRAS